MTLVREAARHCDIRNRQRGIQQQMLSFVYAIPLQPLVRRNASGNPKRFGEMTARQPTSSCRVDQRQVVGAMSAEKLLGSVCLQPRHAALWERCARSGSSIGAPQMSEHRERDVIDEQPARLAGPLERWQQYRCQMNHDRINDPRRAYKMRNTSRAALLGEVVHDETR